MVFVVNKVQITVNGHAKLSCLAHYLSVEMDARAVTGWEVARALKGNVALKPMGPQVLRLRMKGLEEGQNMRFNGVSVV